MFDFLSYGRKNQIVQKPQLGGFYWVLGTCFLKAQLDGFF